MNRYATTPLTLLHRASVRPGRLLPGLLIMLLGVGSISAVEPNEQNGEPPDQAPTSHVIRWAFFQAVEISAEADAPLVDLVLGPKVFTGARADLGDLRLDDNSGQPVPYAFRILRPTSQRDAFSAKEFNRATGPNNSSELTLDLNKEDIEHNEIEISTPGSNFRRKVELEGSDDNKAWSTLTKTTLIRFRRGDQGIQGDAVSYPPSRFRYLRIRLYPDPAVDEGRVTIGSVTVIKKIAVPGEMLTLQATVADREPVNADGGPGSAWIIDLGGDRVPCERLEVEIDDLEFARNYHIEAIGSADSHGRFQRVVLSSDGLWQRRAGEDKQPMIATFKEVRASRLKLVVTDFGNEPLGVRAVKFSAPVRQIVFERPQEPDTQLRLFFGNPKAEAPNYDFARNLPPRLETAPLRATAGPRASNPHFVPPPLPLTERWPWLIYLVLGFVSLVLAVIIISLARTSIAIHDRQLG